MSDSLFQTLVFQGAETGPHVCIVAGVHGDEWEPMAALRALEQELPDLLRAGAVTLVPLLNESAFARCSRTGEDGLDLARVFPGDAAGSLTLRVAAQFHELLAGVDYLVDLHTGGQAYQLVPLSGYMHHQDAGVLEAQRQMALAFGMPLVWGTPANPGRTLSSAGAHNVPAIYAEWGGGSPANPVAARGYADGCLRVLKQLLMVEQAPSGPEKITVVEEFADVVADLCGTHLAEVHGYFEATAELGQHLQKGQLLGLLWPTDREAARPTEVHASQDGLLVCLRAIPSVLPGDSLARLVGVSA